MSGAHGQLPACRADESKTTVRKEQLYRRPALPLERRVSWQMAYMSHPRRAQGDNGASETAKTVLPRRLIKEQTIAGWPAGVV